MAFAHEHGLGGAGNQLALNGTDIKRRSLKHLGSGFLYGVVIRLATSRVSRTERSSGRPCSTGDL